jgi:hypothetical protein
VSQGPGAIWPVLVASLLGLFVTLVGLGGGTLRSGKNPGPIGVLGTVANVGVSAWLGFRWGRRKAEHALEAKSEELLAEFPQECQTWRGRAALADQEILQGVLRELETPTK